METYVIPFLCAFFAMAATSSYPRTEFRQVALISILSLNVKRETHSMSDSFMIFLIFSSFALIPTTQCSVKLLAPSAKIVMDCNKFLIMTGLKTFNSN